MGLCAPGPCAWGPALGPSSAHILGPSPASPLQDEKHCVKAVALSLWLGDLCAQHFNKGAEREMSE